MTRLLRIITRMNVGGPARHVLRVAQPLAERGFETLLVTGRPGPGEGDLTDAARQAGQTVVEVPHLGRALRPGSDLTSLWRVRRLIQEWRPDVVHTHTAKAGVVGRGAALSCKGPRPALVHTFHGHVLSGYFSALVGRAFATIERRLARRTDALICVSQAVERQLREDHGVIGARPMEIVPPGFDVERTRPDPAAGRRLRAEWGLAADEVLVGMVGRLAPVKRPALARDAVARARAAGLRARLVIVGDGPLREALTRSAVGAEPPVIFVPPRDDLTAVYAALDLLLLTSASEGLPQAVAESLAAGVPVVATDVGGVSELVRDGVDGLLVPADADTELVTTGLAAALLDLGGAADRRRRFAAAAAARTWDEHGAEAVAERLAAVYAAVLSAGTRPAAGPPTHTASSQTCTSSS